MSSIRKFLAILAIQALLATGCTQLSQEDRATLDQVRSIANDAKMEAIKASAAAQAAQEAATRSEAKATAAADAAVKAAADARLASERAERMFSRSQRK
ncbi:MAG: alanine-zipper protein [Ferrovibrio sp.]|uniref:alanine-zipper protein n=1 Tax=Ferrovibrio sp. TaxID=1917215 RepID=UPI002611B154|nr:alanine-zipper protein [Ferrovibrio sp.]MCW0232439.1 alanine-zipper protein [Ferrovibrio sp.]